MYRTIAMLLPRFLPQLLLADTLMQGALCRGITGVCVRVLHNLFIPLHVLHNGSLAYAVHLRLS
jgi:hypothetical protein